MANRKADRTYTAYVVVHKATGAYYSGTDEHGPSFCAWLTDAVLSMSKQTAQLWVSNLAAQNRDCRVQSVTVKTTYKLGE